MAQLETGQTEHNALYCAQKEERWAQKRKFSETSTKQQYIIARFCRHAAD